MAECFDFELVIALPEGNFDLVELSNALQDTELEDPIVGLGAAGQLAIGLGTEGKDAEAAILSAARVVLDVLPTGSSLREVRPDLVSLAEVAERLGVKRQALQQRAMPHPTSNGLFRIDEIADTLRRALDPPVGGRRPRFDITEAADWLRAGPGARRINARLTLGLLDPETLRDLTGDMAQQANVHELKELA